MIAALPWLLSAAVVIWLLWANRAVVTTSISIRHHAIPRSFEGFRIAHMTDLHNARLGREHRQLRKHLTEAHPDIIVMTGDIIDARWTNIPRALEVAAIAVGIAPCYYVMGNHEARIPDYPAFERGLRELGVTVLRNETAEIVRNGEILSLMGVDDPAETAGFTDTVARLSREARGFRLMLSHRPERFEVYRNGEVDLVLCGHAHGGQWQLPLIGGLIAPHQGFFPKYDRGLYSDGNTQMVLSGGLGNSLCPLRINNRPELVLVTLHRDDSSTTE